MKATEEHVKEFKERIFILQRECYDSIEDVHLDENKYVDAFSLFMLEKQIEDLETEVRVYASILQLSLYPPKTEKDVKKCLGLEDSK